MATGVPRFLIHTIGVGGRRVGGEGGKRIEGGGRVRSE